jgi:hypothetical protein
VFISERHLSDSSTSNKLFHPCFEEEIRKHLRLLQKKKNRMKKVRPVQTPISELYVDFINCSGDEYEHDFALSPPKSGTHHIPHGMIIKLNARGFRIHK